MNIKNLKLKISPRGEIATILTIISLGLMLLGAVAGTKLATTPQQTKTLAAYPAWNWDKASEGCPQDGMATCICGNISRANNLNAGFCSPACKIEGAQKCIANKWADPNDANAWGCWGDASLDCKPGMASPTPAGPTPTGPTPTSGSGGVPPSGSCTDGSWACAGVTAEPGIRQLFCSVWCDGQNQWLWERAKSELGDENACGGKKSAPRSGGCPDQVAPSPTRPPAGPPGGGTNPPPRGGSSPTPAPNGFLVVKSAPNSYITLNEQLNPIPKYIGILPQDSKAVDESEVIWGIYAFPFPTGSEETYSNFKWTYTYHLSSSIRMYIRRLKFNSNSPLAVNLDLYTKDIGDGIKIPQNYNICYPTNITPPSDNNWIAIAPTIFKYCDPPSRSNIIQYSGSSGPSVTPTPTPTGTVLKFNIVAKNESRTSATVQVWGKEPNTVIFLKGIKDNAGESVSPPIDLLSSPLSPFSILTATNQRTGSKPITSKDISNYSEIEISLNAQILRNPTASDPNIPCTPPSFTKVLTKDVNTGTNNLGDLIQINIFDNTSGLSGQACNITSSDSTSFAGSANADFQNVMDDYSNGKLTAIDVSRFVSQLTRVPGLQTVTCNPTKGECSAGF